MTLEDRPKRRHALFLSIVLLGLLGLAASLYLAWSHYNILTGKQTQGSFCSVSELVDCDAVAVSPYSEISNVPWAALGALIYVLVLSFALFGYALPAFSGFSFRFLFMISALCVLFDAYLAFVGFAILKLVCIVCIFTYVVNLGILVLSKRGSGASVASIFRETLREIPLLDGPSVDGRTVRRLFFCTNGVILIFGIAMILGMRYHFVGEKLQRSNRILEALSRQKPASLDLGGAPRLGPEDARIKIVEFSDFRCPYCKGLASSLRILQKRYSRDVAIYFKHYPLDAACNQYVQRSLHPEACKLAQVGICAGDLGFFWQAEELLFSSDQRFMDKLKKFLGKNGVPQADFWRCYASQETKDRLSSDIMQARESGVSATPTIFINGRKLEGYFEPFVLAQLIEALMPKGEQPSR